MLGGEAWCLGAMWGREGGGVVPWGYMWGREGGGVVPTGTARYAKT